MSRRLLFLLWFTTHGQAQPIYEPTTGVAGPFETLSGQFDLWSGLRNPAGLCQVRGREFGARYYFEPDKAGALNNGGGAVGGVRGGCGTLPWLGIPRIASGFQLEWSKLISGEDSVRVSTGVALSLGRNLSMGFAWRRYLPTESFLQGVNTFDVGIHSQLNSNYFAAGLVVKDVFSPKFATGTVQRKWLGELTFFPLGDSRMEWTLGGGLGQDDKFYDAWGTLKAELTAGLWLFANGRVRQVDTQTQTKVQEWSTSAGLSASFGAVRATTFAKYSETNEGGILAGGGAFVVATVPERTLQRNIPGWITLDISAITSEKKLVSTLWWLRRMSESANVTGLLVKASFVGGGWATGEELREAISRFRANGKRVAAYIDGTNTNGYYVATAAEKIYLEPAGMIAFVGVSTTLVFLKGAFEKLGIRASFERIGEYKSAPEMYLETAPTEPSRQVRESLLDDISLQLKTGIAQGRKKGTAQVEEWMDKGPYNPGAAKKNGLVDELVEGEELTKRLVKDFPGFRFAQFRERPPRRHKTKEIAVIDFSGDIISGKSRRLPLIGRASVGEKSMVALLDSLVARSEVAGIVLRIDSPGGSAYASDLIARAVKRADKRKPVVCSFGDIAASGGYFAAAHCRKIFASALTITGSIGIFSGKFDIAGLLEKAGISLAVFQRGNHAGIFSRYREFSESERAVVRENIRYYYERFVRTVASGRGLSFETVDAVGQGRVWSGVKAKKHKLVDVLEGVDGAIEYVRTERKLSKDVSVKVYPRNQPTLLAWLTGNDQGQVSAATWERWLRWLPDSLLWEPTSIQARLPAQLLLE